MNKLLLETFIKEVIKESKDYKDVPANKITWGMLSDAVESVLKKEKAVDTLSFLYDKFKLITPTWVNVTLSGVEKYSDFIAKFLAKAYNINGKEKSDNNPFEIDPNVSKLLDDEVEEKFIKHLSWECRTYDRDKPIINFNMTKELHEWLKKEGRSEYGGANITSDSLKKPTDIRLNPWDRKKEN